MENLRKVLPILLFLQIGCNENKIEEEINEPFVGVWSIRQVSRDGILQGRWENLSLSFEQTGDKNGIYHLPQSPYDSIWFPTGRWNTTDRGELIFDDTMEVSYLIRREELLLSKILPWTRRFPICDPDDPEVNECPIMVGNDGIWLFELVPYL